MPTTKYYQSQVPVSTIGVVQGQPPSGVPRTNALIEAGNFVKELGQYYSDIKTQNDFAVGIAEYNTLIEDYKLSIRGKDPSVYVKDFDKLTSKMTQIYKGKSQEAVRQLKNKINVWNLAHRSMFAAQQVEDEAMVSKMALPDMVNSFVANGQKKEWQEHLDGLNESGAFVNPAEKKKYEMLYDVTEKQQNTMRAINYAGATLLPEDIRKANDEIDKNYKTEVEKKPYRDQLTSVINNARTAKNEQIEANDSAASKELTNLLMSGQLTTSDVMNRESLLKDDSYKTWGQIALNPPDKKGNIIEETTLKIAASDIWRGAITKDEFDKKVMKSLADPNGINTKQYAAVMDIADSKLEKSQAEDMRRFSRDAANVILGQFSGLLQFDAMGNLSGINLAGLSGDDVEDAKYRFNYLSNYEQGLRDFIAANPKASGKEFYQFASEQKIRYWNASLEDIKATAQRQGKATNVISPEELRKQNTKEAYEQGVTLGYWK